jgi:hypothetical protein
MALRDLLQEKKDTVVQRWLDKALTTYCEDSSAVFKREKDQFANPVGHSLREGTQGIFAALLNSDDEDRTRECLREIIKIRAVQEMSASEALRFVFDLKDVAREVVNDAGGEARFTADLTEFERKIDGIALAAFDLYAECREQVSRIRLNEAQRRVSWIVEKLNERGLDPGSSRLGLDGEGPTE